MSRYTIDTGVQVYFCDPRSPWQRGSNENTYGLLRQHFPKGTNMYQLIQDDLNEAAHCLNTRPRQTLGWMTPSDKTRPSVPEAPLRPHRFLVRFETSPT